MSSAWNSDLCQVAVKVSSFISSIEAIEASTRLSQQTVLMPINRTKVKPGHSPWRPNINPGDGEVHQCHQKFINHQKALRLCDACLEIKTNNKQGTQPTNKNNK